MAIKASASVTLSAVVDVQAVWKYYLLQSSTLAAPAKPTTFPPPAAWDDTEPVYDPAQTQTLYEVICNVFSDGSFDYTDVSVSTAFEAAKAAYNKAAAAEGTANEAIDGAAQNATAIVELEGHTINEITKSQDDIIATVAEQYYVKGDTDRLVSEVSTQVQQTNEEINIQFTRFNADLDAVAAGTDAEFEEIKRFIRFVNGRILLGEVGNELELQIANDKIAFLQNGAEVAYFSNNKLYVTDAHFINSLQLGDFVFMPRANGNLSFKKLEAVTGSNVVSLAVVGIAEVG